MKVALACVLLAAGISGCGGDPAPTDDDRPFNDADVTFATEMVQHHAGALLMVDLTVQRKVSPQLAALAERIRTTQTTEMETMVDWLQEWGEPVPETVRDHANAHGDHGGDLAELEALQGPEFEEEWLDLMIEHHAEAVDLAAIELEHGEWPAALELADQIGEVQEAEIVEMEQLADSSGR